MSHGRRHRSHNPVGHDNSTLTRVVDAFLVAVLAVAPLAMAGRHPIGQLVYVALCAALATAWLIRQTAQPDARWRWSGVEWLLLAGVVIVLVQILPLPTGVLDTLSPAVRERLPLWTGGDVGAGHAGAGHMGAWTRISLVPWETRGGLTILLSHCLLFTVIFQRLQTLDDVERLLKLIAVAVTVMAALGLAQLLLGNGKFLWVYEHPSRDTNRVTRGAFTNENHFAHFLALGIGALIWWAHRARPDGSNARGSFGRSGTRNESELFAVLAMIAVVSLAGLLTLSRGGVLVLFVSAAATIGFFTLRKMMGLRALAVVAGTGVVVGVAMSVYGYDSLVNELQSVGGDLDRIDPGQIRRKLWAADVAALKESPWMGSGVGSHRMIYPIHYSTWSPVNFSHAESGFLQVAVEAGLAGLAVLLAVAIACVRWSLTSLKASDLRAAACAAAVVGPLIVSLLHSIVDFVWYIPACLSLTLACVACVCRVAQLTRETERGVPERLVAVPRFAWGAAVLVLAGTGVTMVTNRLPAANAARHWDSFLAISLGFNETQSDDAQSQVAVERMYDHLVKAAAANPNSARVNLRLAGLTLRHFAYLQQQSPNPMSLVHIRDAAIASKFPSRQALNDWLARAIGENARLLDSGLYHARRALRLCPVQGNGYVLLADLSFLEGASPATPKRYIDQARRVRPYHGGVLVAAGREAAMLGDLDSALGYWRQAFHQDPDYRTQIANMLAPQVPAEFFLEHFEPTMSDLRSLFDTYWALGRADEATSLGRNYVSMLQKAVAAADRERAFQLWRQAQLIYVRLDDPAEAIACAKRALELQPNDYDSRKQLIDLLMTHDRREEAIPEIQWCLRRYPHNADLKEKLAQASAPRFGTASRLNKPGTER